MAAQSALRRDLLPAAALLAAAGAPAALAAEAPPLDGRRAPSPAVGPARRPEPLAPGAPTVKTPSGLKYTDVTIGQGDPPPAGAQVTIDYVMAAAAGRFGFSVIDRTKDHEGPFTFKLDDPSIIAGLQEGVSTMRAGGVRRL
ncbi:unnamed protein product [Prorocentrum cordatum]|uniref:peptidylprolyl isomerase n=1 Tax=Prorocentrum cordatum TaxID=2364126 RepID=A0ABN9V9V4_9DINO|nr:unnamed protein product [Polarella glacialis]